jgi:hypothetical protein
MKIIYCENNQNDSKVTGKLSKQCGYDSSMGFRLPDEETHQFGRGILQGPSVVCKIQFCCEPIAP